LAGDQVNGFAALAVVAGARIGIGARNARAVWGVPGKSRETKARIAHDACAVGADCSSAPDGPITDRQIKEVEVGLSPWSCLLDVGEGDWQRLGRHGATRLDGKQHGERDARRKWHRAAVDGDGGDRDL